MLSVENASHFSSLNQRKNFINVSRRCVSWRNRKRMFYLRSTLEMRFLMNSIDLVLLSDFNFEHIWVQSDLFTSSKFTWLLLEYNLRWNYNSLLTTWLWRYFWSCPLILPLSFQLPKDCVVKTSSSSFSARSLLLSSAIQVTSIISGWTNVRMTEKPIYLMQFCQT